MTSHTPAEDDHLLDEDTLVPETQLESPGTFSQRIVTRLGIRSFIGNVDAATSNANPNYKLKGSSYNTLSSCAHARLSIAKGNKMKFNG